MNEIAVAFRPANRRVARRQLTAASNVNPARLARQLALAHALQRRLESGEFANQAALARALGFSRERISKLLDLLNVAPDIQEQILFLECAPGSQLAAEADLHQVVLTTAMWKEQQLRWARLKGAVLVDPGYGTAGKPDRTC